MEHGGKRSNAGRKPGAISKLKAENAELAKAGGILPLEVMLRAMRIAYRKRDYAAAVDYAQAAAPYVHPKLSSIQTVSTVTQRTQIISSEPMSDDEWEQQYSQLATSARPAEGTH